MDHFARHVEPGFARHEDDPSPAALGHAGRVAAREANAAHHIDLEEAQPVGVGDLEERLALIDAEVVDQNVDLRHAREHRLGAGGRCAVRGDAVGLRVGHRFAQARRARRRRRLRAAGDRDTRALGSQAAGDGKADARGRSDDQGVAILEMEIHVVSPRGGMNWCGVLSVHDTMVSRRGRIAPDAPRGSRRRADSPG